MILWLLTYCSNMRDDQEGPKTLLIARGFPTLLGGNGKAATSMSIWTTWIQLCIPNYCLCPLTIAAATYLFGSAASNRLQYKPSGSLLTLYNLPFFIRFFLFLILSLSFLPISFLQPPSLFLWPFIPMVHSFLLSFLPPFSFLFPSFPLSLSFSSLFPSC